MLEHFQLLLLGMLEIVFARIVAQQLFVVACALLGDEPAQVILLDEPTNHLDVRSVEHLEMVLADFRGALVVVSHDAAFLEALELDTVWTLDAETGLTIT